MQSAGQLCRGRWIKEPDREIEEGESCQPDSSVCCCMEREGGREGKKIKPNGFLKCAPARHTAALGVRGGDEQFAKSSICPPTQPPLPPSPLHTSTSSGDVSNSGWAAEEREGERECGLSSPLLHAGLRQEAGNRAPAQDRQSSRLSAEASESRAQQQSTLLESDYGQL